MPFLTDLTGLTGHAIASASDRDDSRIARISVIEMKQRTVWEAMCTSEFELVLTCSVRKGGAGSHRRP